MTRDRRHTEISEPVDPSVARARDQNEQVKEKVEECAAELTSVNVVLKREIAETLPSKAVEHAIAKSTDIEAKVQECADDLATVNRVLNSGIDEHTQLEQTLLSTNAALSESNARADEASYLALHDALTRLPNMTLFTDRLGLAVAQAERHQWRFAVMFIDLDGFKVLNDAFGHDIGDRVLQIVAERLQSVVRSGDTVCRRSGDEFLFLMLEAKDEADTRKLALKIIAAVAEPCHINGITVAVTPSLGIALYPEDGSSPQELLKNADEAMYAAKEKKSGHAFVARNGRIEAAVARRKARS